MAQGSWLMPQGSCHGSWPKNIWRGVPRPRALAQLTLRHEPWAMSHEPLTTNNRLINDLFDYILYVIDIPKKSFRAFRKTLVQTIFEMFSDGSSSLFGPHVFQICQNCGFQHFEIHKVLLNKFPDFPIFLKVSWYIQINKYRVLQVQISINHGIWRFWSLT